MTTAFTIHTALSHTTQAWSHDTAQVDAELLLCHVLHVERTYLYTWPEKPLSSAQWQAFQALVKRREQGEPIAYILGTRAFWSLDFDVTPEVLIPRPETELLVETTLQLTDHTSANILELGTGSGAIICSLAHERPSWQCTATDFSTAALSIAKPNAQKHQLANITFLQGSWFDSVPQQSFDVIISNPPYIAGDDPHLKQGDCRFEPQGALTSGQTGLEDLEHIIARARTYLAPQGWVLLEHGYDQAVAVAALFKQYGFDQIEHRQDLAGMNRITVACSTLS